MIDIGAETPHPSPGWKCAIFGKVPHDEAFSCQQYHWRGDGWCMKSCQNCINGQGRDSSEDCE